MEIPELFTKSLVVAGVVNRHDCVNVSWKSTLFVGVQTAALEDLEALGAHNKANVFHTIIRNCGIIIEAMTEFEVRVKIVFRGKHLLASRQARILSWS